MIKGFDVLNLSDYLSINGGAVGGAVVGWIFGGTAGLAAYSGQIAVSGKATPNGAWKAYIAGATAGLGIGAVTPF